MKTVEVLFQNLQSHENTKFMLKPGMNFILADGNNVGKSTIFKVLSRIAKAPNINSSKILPLIRYGKSEALAAFKFDGESVIARFTKYDGESAKIFFEHVHPDGETTRSAFCPKSLLDALGIVVGENGELINFNDANSVQLISEVSTEADNIITHVMLDPKVETIKQNMYALGREVNVDLRTIGREAEASETILRDMQYRPTVSEFNECLPQLEAACRICDNGIPEFQKQKVLPTTEELSVMKAALDVATALDGFIAVSSESRMSCTDVSYGAAICRILRGLDSCDLKEFSRKLPSLDGLARYKQVHSLALRLQNASRLANSLQDDNKAVLRMSEELAQVSEELKNNSRSVECPIKGKVLYTDEKCVPYRS